MARLKERSAVRVPCESEEHHEPQGSLQLLRERIGSKKSKDFIESTISDLSSKLPWQVGAAATQNGDLKKNKGKEKTNGNVSIHSLKPPKSNASRCRKTNKRTAKTY